MKTREEIKAELRAENPTSDGRATGDPVYEALLDKWTDAAMAQQEATAAGWPTVQQFMDAFTDAELGAVDSSDDANVAGLRARLYGWRDRVHADDTRIQLGLGLLVQLGILTEDRKNAILATANPI